MLGGLLGPEIISGITQILCVTGVSNLYASNIPPLHT